jgi:hypothetical protein
MSRIRQSRRRPQLRPPTPRARPQVELLEGRDLPSTGTFLLTNLVPVSGDSPLPPPPSSPTVFYNSEVEPQIAVDPRPGMAGHAVAIWQQDRYRSVGGARALVVSVTTDASDPTAIWSPPTPIPYFNSTDATFNTIDPVTGQGYARYTDPWVSIAPNGDVYAVALAMTPVGPVPGHTAVLVSKSTDGGVTWGKPTMLIHDDAPPGTDPADLANDKEMVIADPTNANRVYVVWDRLNHPSDQQNFNAAHGLPFREDMMFARTTDGGATWDGGNYPAAVPGYPASDVTNFQANESAFGNEIVVQPGGTLVDVFADATGSGNQAAQADHNVLGVMRSTDHGATWSAITDGPGIETVGVTDPDTGAPVRSGEPLTSVAVDPTNGNLYAVWADARFSSKFSADGIAFSMSTDGGLTWSDPIKVNQTPTNIPAGDQQAFTPVVAVNSAGTVAVGYYDFRNNTDLTPGSGLPTDFWLVHASGNFTSPGSWTADEKRLTDTSFNMENAAPTSRGLFLGDYEGLAAAGTSFYALFAQAGSSASDPSNIWFRDPPPAPASPTASAGPAAVAWGAAPALGELGMDGLVGVLTGSTPAPGGAGLASVVARPRVVDQLFSAPASPRSAKLPVAPPADIPLSGSGGTDAADNGDVPADAALSDPWDNTLPGQVD